MCPTKGKTQENRGKSCITGRIHNSLTIKVLCYNILSDGELEKHAQ